MFYIYHHLGLGDHIICNGLVRYFAELYGEVTIFCKEHYASNVKYMYRDNPKIHIISVPQEWMVSSFLNQISKDKYLKIGFENLPYYEQNFEKNKKTFDEAFYLLAKVDFLVRFKNFFIQRDEQKEQEALDYLNPNHEPYIYVHDDPSRGYTIDENKHRKDLKIIKNSFNFNLFEMRKILENATEIHTMQTGMLDLCNSFTLSKPKIFHHTYVRKYPDFYHTKGINYVKKIG
jgi:hypothetical protein